MTALIVILIALSLGVALYFAITVLDAQQAERHEQFVQWLHSQGGALRDRN